MVVNSKWSQSYIGGPEKRRADSALAFNVGITNKGSLHIKFKIQADLVSKKNIESSYVCMESCTGVNRN